MDALFEFIVELLFDSFFEASKNPKVPKPLRIFFACLVVLFVLGVISLVLILGIHVLIHDNVWAGIILTAIGLIFLVLGVIKFRTVYIEKKKE